MMIPIEHNRLLILNEVALAAMAFREVWRVGKAGKEFMAFIDLAGALDRMDEYIGSGVAEAPIDPPAIVSGEAGATQ